MYFSDDTSLTSVNNRYPFCHFCSVNHILCLLNVYSMTHSQLNVLGHRRTLCTDLKY